MINNEEVEDNTFISNIITEIDDHLIKSDTMSYYSIIDTIEEEIKNGLTDADNVAKLDLINNLLYLIARPSIAHNNMRNDDIYSIKKTIDGLIDMLCHNLVFLYMFEKYGNLIDDRLKK